MASTNLRQSIRQPIARWALLLIGLIGISLLLQLLLSMLLAEGAYKLKSLREEHTSLQLEVEIIAQEVDSLASPQFLADSANRLGMVVNPSPVFLDLESGAVYGDQLESAGGGVVASRNLVANAALGQTELDAELAVASSAVDQETDVASDEVLVVDSIPASPTR